MANDAALIIQSDMTLLLDVHAVDAAAARDAIAPFSELRKSPEHMHTYAITSLSLWNAASIGMTAETIIGALSDHSRFAMPGNVAVTINDTVSRYGLIHMEETDDPYTVRLVVPDKAIHAEVNARPALQKVMRPAGPHAFDVNLLHRGTVKQELVRIGYPVDDRAPLRTGDRLAVPFRSTAASGHAFHLRDYQIEAAEAFYGGGAAGAGFGTIVLPCGAGKTIVGMAVMNLVSSNTLILTTNVAAVHQWIDELLDKTEIDPEAIGEYTGGRKELRPVTVATYQILVWRKDRNGPFPHFDIFRSGNWGLIVYDEVHLLPAPVFRVTAEIQAIRRLGLTATLVREDNREEDVFSLVGPKRFDVPWKELEGKGWIAEAVCYEIRVDLSPDTRMEYALADKRKKFRIASENERKRSIVSQIIENHPEDSILVIGQYLDQINEIATVIDAPIITGKTPNPKREEIYDRFRAGELRIIVVSKVANFAIDLPDASLAIQVSGSFGSRQEEAQRLGRILRPKKHRNSSFYSIVSNQTVEEQFAAHRQRFLTEQGYAYHIEHWEDADL